MTCARARATCPQAKQNFMEVEMLILTREKDERVFIGDDVIVTVVDIYKNKVRLGFTAPKEVAVHREEVHDKIEAKKGDE